MKRSREHVDDSAIEVLQAENAALKKRLIAAEAEIEHLKGKLLHSQGGGQHATAGPASGSALAATPANRTERKFLIQAGPFEKWMTEVIVKRGFSGSEARETARWAALTASYEVETHGARKLFSLLDHEFARSGSCIPGAEHKVLLSPSSSLEVWDGKKKLGPAIARMAQARSVEMAKAQGMGVVFVRDANHFGWGPAYALEQLSDDLMVGNMTQGAIPIVTPIGGDQATVGSNAIAIALSTGSESCPFFLWDTGTAATSWGTVQKLKLEGGKLPPGVAVDVRGNPAIYASDAAFLNPAGTIGNALGILIELLSANVGAGDPRLRSKPPENVPDGEPNTCVFMFFALNLAMFDGLGFPRENSRKENMRRMVDAVFKDNGTARIVGQRKWAAKQRSNRYGGLLFAPESVTAFQEEAAKSGIALPTTEEVEVSVKMVEVAGKL